MIDRHPDAAGVAVTDTITDSSGPHLGAGRVVLRTSALAAMDPGFSATGRASLMLHELTHVLGLDHTGHRHSVMTPVLGQGEVELTADDRAGLSVLAAAAPCTTGR
jgi:hypothetical protein